MDVLRVCVFFRANFRPASPEGVLIPLSPTGFARINHDIFRLSSGFSEQKHLFFKKVFTNLFWCGMIITNRLQFSNASPNSQIEEGLIV